MVTVVLSNRTGLDPGTEGGLVCQRGVTEIAHCAGSRYTVSRDIERCMTNMRYSSLA